MIKLNNLDGGVRAITVSSDLNSIYAIGSNNESANSRQDYLIFVDRRFYNFFGLDGRNFKVSKFGQAV